MMDKAKHIEQELNDLIAQAVKGGGHVYIVDKLHNDFIKRLTEPIKLQFYGGYKGGNEDGC